MSFAGLLARVCSTLGLLVVIGCHDALAIPTPNLSPVAVAGVAGKEGKTVMVPFTGQPVSVTLDGSASTDPDGSIATYRWLSGTATQPAAAGSGAAGKPASAGSSGAAGGAGTGEAGKMSVAGASAAGSGGATSGKGRWIPPGQGADWPPDDAMTTVMLGEGEYKFVLWVIDNRGAVSLPDTITVIVAPPVDPVVQQCLDKSYPNATRSCVTCICGVSDDCRAAADQSVCDAMCWGLLNCIGSKCPTFDAASGDTSCLVTNCSAFLSGGTGAMKIGGCITPCAAQCSAGN